MKKKSSSNDRSRRSTGNHYTASFDLHGMRADEAVVLVREFLLKHPNSSLLVIHGDGNGILRNRIRHLLANRKLPNRYFFPGEDIGAEGSYGVTAVFT